MPIDGRKIFGRKLTTFDVILHGTPGDRYLQ